MKFLAVIALILVLSNVLAEQCLDKTPCPGSTTCCKSGAGYGCCPYPKGVCCSDEKCCCPNGTVCNVAGAKCERAGNDFLTYLDVAESESEMKELSLKGTPSIQDFIKCVTDAKPIAEGIYEIIVDYTKGDEESKKRATEACIQLAADAATMGYDCWKVIEPLLE